MNTYKQNAKIAGILFILGTAAPITGGIISNSVMSAPNYLQRMSTNQPTMITAIFLQFIMAISCAGITIALYPVLKKFSGTLSIGAVAFRLLEGMLGILVAVGVSSLLILSRHFIAADTQALSSLQVLGDLIKTTNDWIVNGPLVICWIIAAAMYYTVFYQYRLIPRWLTIWGFIGITLTFFSSILMMISPDFGTIQTITSMPILVQEMVLAVWLIVKGFSLPKTN